MKTVKLTIKFLDGRVKHFEHPDDESFGDIWSWKVDGTYIAVACSDGDNVFFPMASISYWMVKTEEI